MVQREGKQWLVALDKKTGDSIFQTAIAPEYLNPMSDGPRAAPTIVGDQVFVFTGEGVLAAVDFQKGKVLWSHAAVGELGGKTAEYGMAWSPLIVGEPASHEACNRLLAQFPGLRDLHPGNVVVGRRGAVVVDFGMRETKTGFIRRMRAQL
jgi:hypothetical protein